MPPQPAQEREPSRRRPWHQGPEDADCRWNLFSMYCRPVGQMIFANWLATTSAMSGKSPIHSSRRLVPGSRLVWTNPSCRVPFWVLRPVQTTAVLSSLASLRKCEDAERCLCSHRFWTLKSVGYLSEIPTTTVCASSV